MPALHLKRLGVNLTEKWEPSLFVGAYLLPFDHREPLLAGGIDGNSLQLAAQAKEHGFNDLRRSGLLKVMQGVTSLAEANRVTTGH